MRARPRPRMVRAPAADAGSSDDEHEHDDPDWAEEEDADPDAMDDQDDDDDDDADDDEDEDMDDDDEEEEEEGEEEDEEDEEDEEEDEEEEGEELAGDGDEDNDDEEEDDDDRSEVYSQAESTKEPASAGLSALLEEGTEGGDDDEEDADYEEGADEDEEDEDEDDEGGDDEENDEDRSQAMAKSPPRTAVVAESAPDAASASRNEARASLRPSPRASPRRATRSLAAPQEVGPSSPRPQEPGVAAGTGEPMSGEGIARRTRAHVSMVDTELDSQELDTELDQLEARLHRSASPSPTRGTPGGDHDSPSNNDWISFLNDITKPSNHQQAVDDSEEDEDEDYNYAADQTRLHEGEEEFVMEEDEEIVEELKGLVSAPEGDHADYARRRSTRRPMGPSGRRLSPRPSLLDGRSSPLAASADRQGATSGRAGSPTSGVRAPPGWFGASTTQGGAPSAGNALPAASSSRGHGGGTSTETPPVRPPAAPTAWPARPFTSRQLRTLQIQMHVHIQMLVQQMIMARQLMRNQQAYAQIALLSYQMLVELLMHCDVTLAHKQMKLRPVHATVIVPDAARNPSGVPSVPQQQQPLSTFQVPGLHLIPEILATTGLRALYDAPSPEALNREAAALRNMNYNAREQLAKLELFSNPHYRLERKLNAGADVKFTIAEDRLFAMGLRRYGVDRFDLIRANLLKTKTQETLQRHYEGQNRRSRPSNPIKRARDGVAFIRRLNGAELALVKHGIDQFGEDWEAINRQMLDSRWSAHEIERDWRAKCQKQAAPNEPAPPATTQVFGFQPTAAGSSRAKQPGVARQPLHPVPPAAQHAPATLSGAEGRPAEAPDAQPAASHGATILPGATLVPAISDSDSSSDDDEDEPARPEPLRPGGVPSKETDRAILTAMLESDRPGDAHVALQQLISDGVVHSTFTEAHVLARFSELIDEWNAQQKEDERGDGAPQQQS